MKKQLIAMLGTAVLGLALAAGCSQAEPEGAMEEAAEDAGEAMEDAAESLGDAAQEAGQAVQETTGTN